MVCKVKQGSIICSCEQRAQSRTRGEQAFPNFKKLVLIYSVTVQASHIQPQDKAILYNIAMIQQKAAQMLFAQAPAKRTLKDLQRGIEQATQAQK